MKIFSFTLVTIVLISCGSKQTLPKKNLFLTSFISNPDDSGTLTFHFTKQLKSDSTLIRYESITITIPETDSTFFLGDNNNHHHFTYLKSNTVYGNVPEMKIKEGVIKGQLTHFGVWKISIEANGFSFNKDISSGGYEKITEQDMLD